MSFDLIDQQLKIPLVCTKENVEDRADDRDSTEQRVDENIENHAECKPAICTELARAGDQIKTDGSHYEVAYDRQQANNRVPAESNAREWDAVSTVEQRGRLVEVIKEPQIFWIYRVMRTEELVLHAVPVVSSAPRQGIRNS